MSYLIDTNVVSEGSRPRPDRSVLQWIGEQQASRMFLSVMTVAELRQGVLLAPAARKGDLGRWLENKLLPHFEGRILDVTMSVADAWGEMAAGVRKRGFSLEAVDGFIAATARVHSLVVVTRNVRDFEPFGIEIFNPFEPA